MRAISVKIAVLLLLLCLGVAARQWKESIVSYESIEEQAPPACGLDYDSTWLQNVKNEAKAIGTDTQRVLSMRWNALKASAGFGQRSTVAAFVENVPIDGRSMLTGEQLELLRRAITTFLFLNANNDREHYFSQLLDSGETLTPKGRDLIAEDALKRGRLDVLEMSPLAQLVWLYTGVDCKWRGLIAEGSRIKVFTTETGRIEDPGRALRDVVRKTVWDGSKKTAPPVSLEDAAKERGPILVADLEVFVSNDRQEVIPYFCRYWFDQVNSIWRLESVVSYPMSFSSHGRIVA